MDNVLRELHFLSPMPWSLSFYTTFAFNFSIPQTFPLDNVFFTCKIMGDALNIVCKGKLTFILIEALHKNHYSTTAKVDERRYGMCGLGHELHW